MSVRPLYQRTPSHLDLLDPKETVLSHNKVTGWSVNLPIAKTCQPSKVCINTCYFSKGGSSRPASDRGRFVGPTVMLLACDGVRHK